jgi:NhaA family Na+:H+ antiporter
MTLFDLRQRVQRKLAPLTEPLVALMHSASWGGILLAAMAVLAIIISNSPWSGDYNALQQFHGQLRLGQLLNIDKPTIVWVNDLWMAVFFLLVGLEIKFEILQGQLSSKKAAALPTFAAIGGMAVPALIYYAFNHSDAAAARGWAIPSATDIAFALGVLILLGSRVPPALKVLLTAIAIIDDLGAILIIAFFYTEQLNWGALNAALWCLTALILLNRLGISRLAVYYAIGLLMWVFLLKSGIHATLAGVLTALCIPMTSRQAAEGWTATDVAQGDRPQYHSPLKSAIHGLHPWVAFLILPVFAFLNAGVDLRGSSLEAFTHTVPLGIILGLLLGKPLGIFSSIWLASKALHMPLPAGCRWSHVLGMSVLCGIGFTMSLFIGDLAFAGHADFEMELKIGVLTGSVLSALAGSAIFMLIRPKMPHLRLVK